MDVQLKKGFIEICVLAVLNRGDSYGYQIIKDISQCIDVSESTLYPILKRLEVGKYLETYSVEHNGRLRKYYRITTGGKEKIIDYYDEWQTLIIINDFINMEA